MATRLPANQRQLSDKILAAFHHAADLRDVEVAKGLLRILEVILTHRPAVNGKNRNANRERLVAAYERLWELEHPNSDQEGAHVVVRQDRAVRPIEAAAGGSAAHRGAPQAISGTADGQQNSGGH